MLCASCGTDAGDVSRYCPSCGSSVVRPTDGDDYVGQVVAKKYRVEEMIGEGGMGKVYRATQLVLDKPVVLKVLRQSLLSDQRTVQRFQREAKAASRLNHPNSISVLDFGQVENGALFIAMEFIAGKDLHQILSKEWPRPEARVIRLVVQVLSALSDAHGAGVIHRDLKPENIMVEQRRGDPDFVKVLDFGIAKITDSTGEEGPALTRAGFVCGTPEYMSPEQARGTPIDHRSDLYAVGVILYQLTTGLLPFESDSAVGFATKHLTEEPPAPTRRRPEAKISPAMERLILKALSKDPGLRPQNADAFREELLSVPRAQATPLRRPSPAPLAAAALRRDTPAEQEQTRPTEAPFTGAAPRLLERVVSDAAAVAPGTAENPAGGMAVFKVITIGLVVVALVLGGIYFFELGDAAPGSDYQPPKNAPVQLGGAAGTRSAPYDAAEPTTRDRERSARLTREGDDAHERGLSDLAAAKYQEAFEKDPNPELALKLGELYLQRNDPLRARGWWARYLRDQGDSKARTYIQQAFPDL